MKIVFLDVLQRAAVWGNAMLLDQRLMAAFIEFVNNIQFVLLKNYILETYLLILVCICRENKFAYV